MSLRIDLERIKSDIDLVQYAEQVFGIEAKRVGRDKWRLNPCPVCGHNDHFTISYNGESWLYHSFAECCQGGSIIDFVQQFEGMPDFQAAVEHLVSKFPHLANASQESPVPVKPKKQPIKPKQKPVKPLPDLKADFKLLHQAMDEENNYFARRGISREVQEEYLLCEAKSGFDYFIENWQELEETDKKTPYTKAYRYFIPVIDPNGEIHYFFSYLDGEIAAGQDLPKVRNLAGRKARFFNDRYLTNPPFENGYIFVCEGVFDALSIETIGYKAISINSVTNVGRLIEVIKKNKDKYENITFVLAFDNDEAGQEATQKAKEALKEIGVEVDQFEFPTEYKDINDLLVADKPRLIQCFEAFEKKQERKQLQELGNASILIDSFIEEINKNMATRGISTGFDMLDEKLGGGLYPGLYTLGAISSLGKTSLALQIADNIAASGHDVIFFSLEMSANEILAKSFSRISGEIAKEQQDEKLIFSTRAILNGRPSLEMYMEMERRYDAIAQNMFIIEGNFHADLAMIQKAIEKHVRIRKTKPLVVVDYLQILLPESDRLTDKQAVDRNVVGFKRLSRDYDIPILLISSFNRENYANAVSYSAYKESGAIEYSSDVIFGLQLFAVNEISDEKKSKTEKENILNDAKNDIPREVELVILKNRNGKAFDRMLFHFYPQANLFQEKEYSIEQKEILGLNESENRIPAGVLS